MKNYLAIFCHALMVIGCLSLIPALYGEVKLPALISNNMLLQSNKPVPTWGCADPGEKVKVTFDGRTFETTAAASGNWRVELKPMASGTSGNMTVEGKNKTCISNVLVGSVWVCSGQSNMEMRIGHTNNAAIEIPKANYPKIRLFRVKRTTALQPQTDVEGHWVECSPETLPIQEEGFSGVAYFFGRDVHIATGVPVGLIEAAWGGTPAEAWTSLSGLRQNVALQKHVQHFENLIQTMPTLKAEYEKNRAEFPEKHKAWKEANKLHQEALNTKGAEVAHAKAKNSTATAKALPISPEPRLGLAPDKDRHTPTFLYNGMIAPLISYAIEGVIWYQGERNTSSALEYRTLFPAMIADWRQKWGQGNFPFIYCQLANFMPKQAQPGESDWAELREAQRLTLQEPNTGMAVLIDVGESWDIHPRNKMEVGSRLARIALAKCFGKGGQYTGPVYHSMKVEGNKIRLSFDAVGGELVARELPATYDVETAKKRFSPLVRNRPNSQLEGFAICEANRKWRWADAVIDGQTVVVSAPEVNQPVAVRYAWANNPTCNLYNKEGLPASPFQTHDESLLITQPNKK